MALLEQLKLLVNLSRIDGEMAELEKSYITNIGKANGFPESSVSTLFYNSHEVIIPDNLTPDQKFNYIFSLVQLMKIDERLYKEEIKFCSSVASRLGYNEQAMFELMLNVKKTSNERELQSLRQLIEKHLKKD